MKRYFYQTEFSEYKPGLITYLSKKDKVIIKMNNIYFYEYCKRITEVYKKLQRYYNNYSLRVKKIVEQDGIDLENINDILKLEMYLYNIVNIYQDDTIFEECTELEENLEKWVHNVDKDTFLAYFDRNYDLDILNNKKMLFDFFSKKPESYICVNQILALKNVNTI